MRANAGEAVDKTLAVKADGLVRIDNVRGHIEVQGWDRSEVTVKGTLDDLAESFTFETSGSTTTVKVETPDNLNRGKGSDLVIHVPSASRVRVELVSADLTMQALHGGVDGRTVSGEIDARDLSGAIVIRSVSGGISVDGAAGPVTFNSVSGAIEAQTDAEQTQDHDRIGQCRGSVGRAIEGADAGISLGRPRREFRSRRRRAGEGIHDQRLHPAYGEPGRRRGGRSAHDQQRNQEPAVERSADARDVGWW